MKWIRYPFLIVAALVFVMTIALFASLNTPWAKEQIEKYVRESCKTCTFSMDRAVLTWRGLLINDLNYSFGKKGAKKLDAKVARAVIRVEILPLFKKEIHVRSVALFSPEVTYAEGDLPEKPKRGGEKESEFEFALDKVNLYDGKFVYVRDHKGTHAVLTVNDINGKLFIEDELMKARFNARMGQSGNFDLLGQASLKKPLVIDTELHVREQDLADLTVFLKPNAGVDLKGKIVKAVAKSRVRADKLNSHLTITFKDFNLKLDEMYDRSDVQAFLITLGAAIALKKDNLGDPKDEKTSTVDTRRKKGESIVHFILTGLKEASLEAAK